MRQCHQLVSYPAPACLPKGGRTFGTLSRAGLGERVSGPPRRALPRVWPPSRGLRAGCPLGSQVGLASQQPWMRPPAPLLLSPSGSAAGSARGRQRPRLATSDCAACSLPLPLALPLRVAPNLNWVSSGLSPPFLLLSLPAIASSRKLSWAAPLPLELHPGRLCSGPAWAPAEGFTEVRVGFLSQSDLGLKAGVLSQLPGWASAGLPDSRAFPGRQEPGGCGGAPALTLMTQPSTLCHPSSKGSVSSLKGGVFLFILSKDGWDLPSPRPFFGGCKGCHPRPWGGHSWGSPGPGGSAPVGSQEGEGINKPTRTEPNRGSWRRPPRTKWDRAQGLWETSL